TRRAALFPTARDGYVRESAPVRIPPSSLAFGLTTFPAGYPQRDSAKKSIGPAVSQTPRSVAIGGHSCGLTDRATRRLPHQTTRFWPSREFYLTPVDPVARR